MRGEGIRFNHKRYSHELLTESNGQQFDIRYDPRDLSHIWVYGEGGAHVCKANSKGLHPTKEETEQVISGRKRVKKRLKKDLKDKQTAGEDFIQKSDPNKEIAKKIDKQPLLKLRKHFHERD
jgi:hypothetical protein